MAGLVLRQYLGAEFADACLPGDGLRGGGVVAAQHHHAHPHFIQSRHSFGAAGTQRIGEGDAAEQGLFSRYGDDRFALLLQGQYLCVVQHNVLARNEFR